MDSSNDTFNEQSNSDSRKRESITGVDMDNDPVWQQITAEYDIVKVLGQGSFGKVLEAVHIKTRKKVAIKMMKNLFDNDYDSKRLVSEI